MNGRKMGVDKNTLRPAPWASVCCQDKSCFHVASKLESLATTRDEGTADFIALARNAFDVMMRRRWYAVPYSADRGDWVALNAHCVQIERGGNTGVYFVSDDPFTCLVEADKWYKQNVEATHA